MSARTRSGAWPSASTRRPRASSREPCSSTGAVVEFFFLSVSQLPPTTLDGNVTNIYTFIRRQNGSYISTHRVMSFLHFFCFFVVDFCRGGFCPFSRRLVLSCHCALFSLFFFVDFFHVCNFCFLNLFVFFRLCALIGCVLMFFVLFFFPFLLPFFLFYYLRRLVLSLWLPLLVCMPGFVFVLCVFVHCCWLVRVASTSVYRRS